MKQCNDCGVALPVSEFPTRMARGVRVLLPCCGSCMSERNKRYAAQYRARNPELARATSRRANRLRRARDPEWKSRDWASYVERHPKRVRMQKRRKASRERAIKAGATVGPEVDPMVVYGRDEGRCALCGGVIKPPADWHVDHIVPLSKGGEHSYRNVQLAHPRCNLRKGASLLGRPADRRTGR